MEKQFLSIKEAARYSSLSTRFLYDLCQNKELKYYRVHKRIVIAEKDLDEYITQNVVECIDWDKKARELNK